MNLRFAEIFLKHGGKSKCINWKEKERNNYWYMHGI